MRGQHPVAVAMLIRGNLSATTEIIESNQRQLSEIRKRRGHARRGITQGAPHPSLGHTHWAVRVRLDVIYA